MEKLTDREQGLMEEALKKEKMKNVSREEKKGLNRALNEARNLRFGDFLPKKTIERLNELRGEKNETNKK